MSKQFSSLVNEGIDSFPQAGASVNLCGQRERKEFDTTETFDPPVEVSLQPSQLCLPLPSSSSSVLKH